jgi:hypothetical protein
VARLLAAKDNHCEERAGDTRGPNASTRAYEALGSLLCRQGRILNGSKSARVSSAARKPSSCPFFCVKGDRS